MLKKNNPGCTNTSCQCLTCAQQAWLDFRNLTGYSGWSVSASGTYMSYSISNSGSFGTSGFSGAAQETSPPAANGNLVTISTDGGICFVYKGRDQQATTRVGVTMSGSISTSCPSDVPTYTQISGLSYPLIATPGGIFCPSYQLPNPVDDLGYAVTQTDSGGNPIRWQKGSGGTIHSIFGLSDDGGIPIKGSIVGGIQKYLRYTTQVTVSLVTTNPASLLATIVLVPDYNPAVVTGTVSLS